jgi:hypothetical protein
MHNAGDFARLHYERLKSDRKLHFVLDMLNEHVVQPGNTVQRSNLEVQSYRRSENEVLDPRGVHSHHNGAEITESTPQFSPMAVHEGAFISQQLAAPSQEVNSLPSVLPHNICSPWTDDEIGWDWSSFSQLATTAFDYPN